MPYALHDDVELYYETFGFEADPALLLVNGLGSQCINYRVEWVERFVAAGFFVIRFDNRDVGLSTAFDDAGTAEPAYTVEDMAETPSPCSTPPTSTGPTCSACRWAG